MDAQNLSGTLGAIAILIEELGMRKIFTIFVFSVVLLSQSNAFSAEEVECVPAFTEEEKASEVAAVDENPSEIVSFSEEGISFNEVDDYETISDEDIDMIVEDPLIVNEEFDEAGAKIDNAEPLTDWQTKASDTEDTVILFEEIPILAAAGEDNTSEGREQDILYSGMCGGNVGWSIDTTGKLLIDGNGSITSNPWIEYKDYILTLEVQGGITVIPENAFKNCKYLVSAELSEGVKSIGITAFFDCTSLETVILPNSLRSFSARYMADSVNFGTFSSCPLLKTAGPVGGDYNIQFNWDEEIPENAFNGCESLEKVTIPEGINTLNSGAFGKCYSLEEVVLPTSLHKLKDHVFFYCTALKNINLVEGLQFIGDSCFYNCSALDKIVIPDTVSTLEEDAFYGCGSATYISIGKGLSVISKAAFCGCRNAINIGIGSNVSKINDYAFSNCKSVEEILLPECMRTIGRDAFYACNNLQRIVFNEGLTSIGDYAFMDDDLLETITLPWTLNNIGTKAFFECDSLDEIISYSENAEYGIDWISFYGKEVVLWLLNGSSLQSYAENNNIEHKFLTISLNNAKVAVIPAQTYTAFGATPSPIVTIGKKELVIGKDFTVLYDNNFDVGTATIFITGKDNYTDTISISFTIVPKSVEELTVSGIVSKTYSGNEQKQEVIVNDGDTALRNGENYTVSYQDNINAGTATIIINGIGNYSGSIDKNFTIAPKSVEELTVSGIVSKTYNGNEQKQEVIVNDGDTTLRSGEHYTVSYQDNINAGTATIIINGIGNYSGSIDKNFTIAPKSVEELTVSGIVSKTYNGNEQKQEVIVNDGDTTLRSGEHYTVSYQDNTNVGTAIIIINGNGNYTGSIDKNFTIAPKSVKELTVSGIVSKTYNGNEQKQEVIVNDSDTTLRSGEHYTVSYQDNINAGTATVTITGIANYKDSFSKTFKIQKAANTMTVQGKLVKVKAKTIKKKKQVIKSKKYLTISNAKGNVNYKLVKVNKKKFKKYFKVNVKNGNITIKKGLKKGTYKLNIDVTASGNGNYLSMTKQVTVTIKVK